MCEIKRLIDADKQSDWLEKAAFVWFGRYGEYGEGYCKALSDIKAAMESGSFNPDPIPLPTIKPGDKDVDTANLIADLLFAFINKDVYCPHDFEIKSFKNALNVLCKHYGQIKYNPRLFEDYLQSMMEVSHD